MFLSIGECVIGLGQISLFFSLQIDMVIILQDVFPCCRCLRCLLPPRRTSIPLSQRFLLQQGRRTNSTTSRSSRSLRMSGRDVYYGEPSAPAGQQCKETPDRTFKGRDMMRIGSYQGARYFKNDYYNRQRHLSR